MWVGIEIEGESWVFISAYGPGSEWSEEEIEELWSELSECVASFGWNESRSDWGFKCPSGKLSD